MSSRNNLQNGQLQGPALVTFPGKHLPLRLVNDRKGMEPKARRTALAALGGLPECVGADRLAALLAREVGLALGRDGRGSDCAAAEAEHVVLT